MPDDSWNAEGCAIARRLIAEGQMSQAIAVLAYVESKALPHQRPRSRLVNARRRFVLGCSVRGCGKPRVLNGKPWCKDHRPRFFAQRAA